MRTFRFYKEIGERWYVDLPEWEGDKEDLQMVAGADLFLEILSQGEGEVDVILTATDFPGANRLLLKKMGEIESWELGEGAWYKLEDYFDLDLTMWLCPVTEFVFGEYPTTIYFCKLEK